MHSPVRVNRSPAHTGTRVAPRPTPLQLRSSRGALLVRSGNVKVGDKAPDFSLVDQVRC